MLAAPSAAAIQRRAGDNRGSRRAARVDELLARGRKNIRFFTSDVTSPELWVTVRGTVVRQAAISDEDLPIEQSVLVPQP